MPSDTLYQTAAHNNWRQTNVGGAFSRYNTGSRDPPTPMPATSYLTYSTWLVRPSVPLAVADDVADVVADVLRLN